MMACIYFIIAQLQNYLRALTILVVATLVKNACGMIHSCIFFPCFCLGKSMESQLLWVQQPYVFMCISTTLSKYFFIILFQPNNHPFVPFFILAPSSGCFTQVSSIYVPICHNFKQLSTHPCKDLCTCCTPLKQKKREKEKEKKKKKKEK